MFYTRTLQWSVFVRIPPPALRDHDRIRKALAFHAGRQVDHAVDPEWIQYRTTQDPVSGDSMAISSQTIVVQLLTSSSAKYYTP